MYQTKLQHTFILLSLTLVWAHALAGFAVATADEFIRELTASPKCVLASSIDIESKLAPFSAKDSKNYMELLTHYRMAFEAFRSEYPDELFQLTTLQILRPFLGNRDIGDFTSAVYPLFLLHATPLKSDLRDYSQLKIRCKETDTPVYGLRIRTSLYREYYSNPDHPIHDFAYVSDVNARILGFTHGQLIPALSRNVEPAPQFLYNGFLEWSKHRRYERNDQLTRPIELTNFGHSSGGEYFLESDHPDFALSLNNFATQEVILTFFLWAERLAPVRAAIHGTNESVENKNDTGSARKPDFVFQLVIVPNERT